MKNRDSHYVQRIIEYCLKIEDILNSIDYDYDVFITGEVYQLASSMCIVQIGENVAGCLMSLKRGMIIFLGGILRV